MARLLRLKRLIFNEMNGVEYIEDVEGGKIIIASLAFQKAFIPIARTALLTCLPHIILRDRHAYRQYQYENRCESNLSLIATMVSCMNSTSTPVIHLAWNYYRTLSKFMQ
jgi:hypothetical protein